MDIENVSNLVANNFHSEDFMANNFHNEAHTRSHRTIKTDKYATPQRAEGTSEMKPAYL